MAAESGFKPYFKSLRITRERPLLKEFWQIHNMVDHLAYFSKVKPPSFVLSILGKKM